LLQSIYVQDKKRKIEIIVVDNGSTDDSIIAINEQFPQTVVIDNGENLGYSGGNNSGLKYALTLDREYVFILNNDTVLDPLCIANLMQYLQLHPEVAAVSPVAYYYNQPDLIYFAGGIINKKGIASHIGNCYLEELDNELAIESQWLSGCAIFTRKNVLKKVGFFENKFFLVFEDTDWSFRVLKAGYKLRVVLNASLLHKVSTSFGTHFSPEYLYYYTRNHYLFIERNFPSRSWPRLFFFATKEAYHKIMIHSSNIFDRNELIKSTLLGFSDYILRRFGNRNYRWV